MLRQILQQKQGQGLSQRQIQSIKLLENTTLDLEQRIIDEINDNPLLEKEIKDDEFGVEEQEYKEDLTDYRDDFDVDYYSNSEESYRTKSSNYSQEKENQEVFISASETFQEELLKRVTMFYNNETKLSIAKYIIGNLDRHGYLRQNLDDMADDLSFGFDIDVKIGVMELILFDIQNIDSSGIGARNLQECLLIQVRHQKYHLNLIAVKYAERIIREEFEALSQKQFVKIKLKQNLLQTELEDALQIISKLNPNPISQDNEITNSPQIIPDFILIENNGEISITLNSRNTPSLKVNDHYLEKLKAFNKGKKSKKERESINFIKDKLDNAKWFIDAIKQRQKTLISTMSAIKDYQKEYFLSGDTSELKPLIRQDIADVVKLDNSTISRVVNTKYVQTPFGVFSLKFFFSKSISTNEGGKVSTYKVKNIIQDLINEEDKENPYTDIELTNILKKKGYQIERKTIGKFREKLKISTSSLRNK